MDHGNEYGAINIGIGSNEQEALDDAVDRDVLKCMIMDIDDALEVVVRLAERRHRATRSEGFGHAEWVMRSAEANLYNEFLAGQPRPFIETCRSLRKDMSLSRVIHIIARWYEATMYLKSEAGMTAGMLMSGSDLATNVIEDLQGEQRKDRGGSIHTR